MNDEMSEPQLEMLNAKNDDCDAGNHDRMSEALDDIRKNKLSVRKAAAKYGLSKSTLHDRLVGKVAEGPTKMGPDPYLSIEEESLIAKWCIDLSQCGFPLKKDDLLNTVQKIIKDTKRNTPFTNNRPGKTWLNCFFKRHPQISMREAESITKGRAVVTKESILKWFRELTSYLENLNHLEVMDYPQRILNGDETSFCLCPKTGKVIAPKGYKNIYQIQSGNEKETITVLIVFSADGNMLPPMVVFPYLRPPKDVVNSMPKDWFLGRTESGWMRSETFFEYVANCVDVWLEEHCVKKPVILFVDGHKSHLTLELSKFCSDHQIILYALPPNTTHMMQPADVSVFKPLKVDWKRTVREWQSENVGEVLTKKNFCPLLEKAISSNKNMIPTIKNGFRKCGLYPLDPQAVDYTKCVKNTAERLINKTVSTPCEVIKDTRTSETDKFKNAVEVIKLLAAKLTYVGIDVNLLLTTIINETPTDAAAIESSLSNLSVGVYNLNDDGTLEKITDENIERLSDTISIPEDVNDPNKVDDGTLEKITYENIERLPDTISIPEDVNDPNKVDDGTLEKITDENIERLSDTISIPEDVYDYQVCSPTVSSSSSSASIVRSHLLYPKLLVQKKIKKEGEAKQPNAISSAKWREMVEKKEKEKEDKIIAIQKRKEQRLKKREKKLSNKKSRVNAKKQNCQNCFEELESDIEDDLLKNIGCDKCVRWFHLKCTSMSKLSYLEASKKDFICNFCFNKT